MPEYAAPVVWGVFPQMTTPTWRHTGEIYSTFRDTPADNQSGLLNDEVIGSVRIERSGVRSGEWFWAMCRVAPDVDLRFEREGWVANESEAKARVIGAYNELMRRARDEARQRVSRRET